LISTNLN